MHSLSIRRMLAFLGLLGCAVAQVKSVPGRETNADRMRRGLPPSPPKRMFNPTRVRREHPAPSSTPCSAIGTLNMAIEYHTLSPDTLVGYVGLQSAGYYNQIFSNIGNKGGALFNVFLGSNAGFEYNAISIPAAGTRDSWCAEVNQWDTYRNGSTKTYDSSQDLYNVDNVNYPGDAENYLFNVDCTNSAGYYQRYDYSWDSSTGQIYLEWDQPDGTQVFPVPWLLTGSSVFRWYPPGVTPYTPSISGTWTQGYVKWSCT
ncbi:hypothetical protein B0H11DRAFT_151636 [Mycena galericulata]|nr:hypothetical protein B0H11DRAFT_151636 [Mycena galericulata]